MESHAYNKSFAANHLMLLDRALTLERNPPSQMDKIRLSRLEEVLDRVTNRQARPDTYITKRCSSPPRPDDLVPDPPQVEVDTPRPELHISTRPPSPVDIIIKPDIIIVPDSPNEVARKARQNAQGYGASDDDEDNEYDDE